MPYNGYNFEYVAGMPGGTGPGSGVNEINIVCQRLTGYDGTNKYPNGQQYDICREAAINDYARGKGKLAKGIPTMAGTTPAPTIQSLSDDLKKFETDFVNNFENVNAEQNSNTNAVEDLKKTVQKIADDKSSPSAIPTWGWVAIVLGALFLAKKVFKLF